MLPYVPDWGWNMLSGPSDLLLCLSSFMFGRIERLKACRVMKEQLHNLSSLITAAVRQRPGLSQTKQADGPHLQEQHPEPFLNISQQSTTGFNLEQCVKCAVGCWRLEEESFYVMDEFCVWLWVGRVHEWPAPAALRRFEILSEKKDKLFSLWQRMKIDNNDGNAVNAVTTGCFVLSVWSN